MKFHSVRVGGGLRSRVGKQKESAEAILQIGVGVGLLATNASGLAMGLVFWNELPKTQNFKQKSPDYRAPLNAIAMPNNKN